MSIRPILLATVALTALSLPASGSRTAEAQTLQPVGRQHFQGPDGRRGGAVLPVREIIAAVRSQLGAGDVIGSPSLEDGGGRPFYIVRWRGPNGVVQDYRVDARSGRVMGRIG